MMMGCYGGGQEKAISNLLTSLHTPHTVDTSVSQSVLLLLRERSTNM